MCPKAPEDRLEILAGVPGWQVWDKHKEQLPNSVKGQGADLFNTRLLRVLYNVTSFPPYDVLLGARLPRPIRRLRPRSFK